MAWVITIAGWLQIAFGAFAFSVGKSAMTETTAVCAIGFGVVALALGRMLEYRAADDARREADARQARLEANKIR